MLTIVGIIVVLASVVVGFMLEGGNLHALFQPIELLIIGGAAAGALIISSPVPLMKEIMKQLMGTIKHKGPGKQEYLDLLNLMYKLFKQAKQNLLSIEAHIENPEGSDIFKEFPSVLKNHHAIHFICDTLKVQVASPMGPFELEELMDKDLKVAHAEEHLAPSTITRIGDAFPGLGIVAAVLGVVITMGKLSQGKEVIGHSVGAALVGTFIGILLSYGFFQPLAAKMELNLGEEGKYLEVLKVGILAFAKDSSPKVCVEFARRAIPPQVRPSFEEVDQATSGGAKAAA